MCVIGSYLHMDSADALSPRGWTGVKFHLLLQLM